MRLVPIVGLAIPFHAAGRTPSGVREVILPRAFDAMLSRDFYADIRVGHFGYDIASTDDASLRLVSTSAGLGFVGEIDADLSADWHLIKPLLDGGAVGASVNFVNRISEEFTTTEGRAAIVSAAEIDHVALCPRESAAYPQTVVVRADRDFAWLASDDLAAIEEIIAADVTNWRAAA